MVSEWTKATLIGGAVGFAAGLIVAIGGAIKDSPYEGFKPLTFARSPIIGTIEGAILQPLLDGNPAITFLGTIATERMTVEGYKLLRAHRPGKFEIGEYGRPKGQFTLASKKK